MPLCPPQIPHGLTWDRIQASALRCRCYSRCSIRYSLTSVDIPDSSRFSKLNRRCFEYTFVWIVFWLVALKLQTVVSAIRRHLPSCDTLLRRKSLNRNRLRFKKLTLHPILYLHTCRWNRVIANTLMRKFALYKQRSPIPQPRYTHFALTKHA